MSKCTFSFFSTECKDGWYGLNCSLQCVGHCRDGTACNHVTGQCDTGCAAGWTGAICDNGNFTSKTNTLFQDLVIYIPN